MNTCPGRKHRGAQRGRQGGRRLVPADRQRGLHLAAERGLLQRPLRRQDHVQGQRRRSGGEAGTKFNTVAAVDSNCDTEEYLTRQVAIA